MRNAGTMKLKMSVPGRPTIQEREADVSTGKCSQVLQD